MLDLIIISQIGIGYIVVIIVIMHKIRQDYNPISRYISEYALGKYGQLASSSFIIYGLSILGIYIGLSQVLHSKIGLNIGLTLIAIWGMSKVIIGFFRVDLKDQKLTIQGTVHSIASIIGVASYAIGSIILSTSFFTLMLAKVALVLVILLFVGILGDLAVKYDCKIPNILWILHNFTGLIERILSGISVLWLLIMANWLSKLKLKY